MSDHDEFESFADAQKRVHENSQGPSLILNPGEQPTHFSEWKTATQLKLEHDYVTLAYLMHAKNLSCRQHPEHAQHPFCKLEERMTQVLKKISGKGDAYKFPTRSPFLELGDEESPSSPPSPEQRAQYEHIHNAVTRAEEQLKQFQAKGAQISVVGQAAQQTGIPVQPFRGRDGRPITPYQPESSVTDVAGARIGSGIMESVRAAGVTIEAARQSEIDSATLNRLIVEARTREAITRTEKEGTISEYLNRAIEQAAAVYETCGLNAWAQEARQLQVHMDQLTPEQLAWMDRRRQAGDIIFPMPRADVQLDTYRAALEQMKPQFKNKDGRRQMQADTSYVTDHLENLAAARDASLVEGISNNPYFAVFTPSDRTPEDSRNNKNLDQQLAWVQAQQRQNVDNRPGTVAFDAIAPAEYDAAQIIWTHKGGEPLDEWGWTRFVKQKLTPGGNVLYGDWDPVESRLRFLRVRSGAYGDAGVRLLGRVFINLNVATLE